MPSSTAGVTQFFSDYKSKIELQPGHVIAIAVVIMVVVILLHVFLGGVVGV